MRNVRRALSVPNDVELHCLLSELFAEQTFVTLGSSYGLSGREVCPACGAPLVRDGNGFNVCHHTDDCAWLRQQLPEDAM